MAALPPLPSTPDVPDGLWSGPLDRELARRGRGRTRRWSYTAAGSAEAAVGAAVIDLGYAATAFAWALVDGQVLTWDARGLPRRSTHLGAHAASRARFAVRGASVAIGPGGGLDLDVPVEGGRLRATLAIEPDQPAVCITPTAGGGWNTTQKVAGERARIHVSGPGVQLTTTGGAWRDWTRGAQDRHTTWRWAAGAGRAVDGRRVGMNVSSGMNAAGPGEDVVWWDGVPHPLELSSLAPVVADDPAGDWRVSGPGWALELQAQGVRAADENLWVVRSRYVQPIGRLVGTLPDPAGDPIQVDLVGVTEDHVARW